MVLDLQGHSHGSRMELFMMNLAPVVASHLGFLGSTGAAGHIHYMVGDRVATPAHAQGWFTEKLIVLPDSLMASDLKDTEKLVLSKTRQELRAQKATLRRTSAAVMAAKPGFVYCMFNRLEKIEPVIFSVWMRILRETEAQRSVLWLLRNPGEAEGNLRAEAEARGVDPSRLVFTDMLDYRVLVQYESSCDCHLDTLVFNSATTAVQVHFGRVPIVTLPMQSMSQRIAASVLLAANVDPVFVTRSLDEYVAVATNMTLLEAYDADLNSPLYDLQRYGDSFSRGLEAAWEIQAVNRTRRRHIVL